MGEGGAGVGTEAPGGSPHGICRHGARIGVGLGPVNRARIQNREALRWSKRLSGGRLTRRSILRLAAFRLRGEPLCHQAVPHFLSPVGTSCCASIGGIEWHSGTRGDERQAHGRPAHGGRANENSSGTVYLQPGHLMSHAGPVHSDRPTPGCSDSAHASAESLVFGLTSSVAVRHRPDD